MVLKRNHALASVCTRSSTPVLRLIWIQPKHKNVNVLQIRNNAKLISRETNKSSELNSRNMLRFKDSRHLSNNSDCRMKNALGKKDNKLKHVALSR